MLQVVLQKTGEMADQRVDHVNFQGKSYEKRGTERNTIFPHFILRRIKGWF